MHLNLALVANWHDFERHAGAIALLKADLDSERISTHFVVTIAVVLGARISHCQPSIPPCVHI